MMMPVMIVMMLVVMVVTAAFVVVVVMVMVGLVLVFIMVVMVLVLVMMMVMLMFIMIVVIVVIMMMTAAAFAVLVMMVMMLVLVFLQFMLQLFFQKLCVFHGVKNLLAIQHIPGRGDDVCLRVQLAQERGCLRQLFLGCILRAAENDGACVLHLVAEEFAEILEVDFALLGIHNRRETVQPDVVAMQLFHSGDDVAELADAGRLDDDAVGMIGVQHLAERLLKVADQAAADTAGVHLGDLYAGIFEESAIDADLTEFILDEDDLLAAERLGEQLFDQRGLACAEKAGDNINFRHCKDFLCIGFHHTIILL